MQIKTNYSLTALNTFQITVKADYFVEIKDEEDLESFAENSLLGKNKRLILGGGSNILFVSDFRGIVIHPTILGIEKIDEDESSVLVRVGSGVVWDDFVKYAIENNWGGIENLSIIPGNVGASPVQNIGAYGVEVRDIIEKVEGFQLNKFEFLDYSNTACRFGYRTSIFKQDLKNNFLVTRVTYRLSKPPHKLKTHYGMVEDNLRKHKERSISTIRQVVTEIRNSKLPDTKRIGNAGSFFKNPVVNDDLAARLKERYPDIPAYPAESEGTKLSAAWLIDKAKCKGIRRGNSGTFEKQPLVIVNLGNATGKDIIGLANYIQEAVESKFGVQLEPEVNIV